MRSYNQTIKLRASTQNLLSNIKYVQELAIITAVKHGIIFDLKANCYYLIKDGASPQLLEQVKLGEVELKSVNFPLYNKSGFKGQAVIFKKLGNLDHGNGRIKLELNNKLKEIIFSSNAGEINIK